MRAVPRLRVIGIAVALLLGFAGPARAWIEFVSNTNTSYFYKVQVGGENSDGDDQTSYYQGFRTGTNQNIYQLKGVTVRLFRPHTNGTFEIVLCQPSSDDHPDYNDCEDSFDIAVALGERDNTYRSDSPIALAKNTTYFIGMRYDPPASGSHTKPEWILTDDDEPNEESDYGWTIENRLWGRGWDGNSWEWTDWGTGGNGNDNQAFHMTLLGNTVPTADAPNPTINEDEEYTFAADIFGFQDGDSGDSLDHVQITVLPEHGTLTLDGENVTVDEEVSSGDLNNLKYTPPDDVNGSPFTTFKFKVHDSYEYSDEYTFTFNVDPVNDAPTADNSTVDVDEDTEYEFAVDDFGFTDIDSDEDITQNTTLNAALAGIKITSLPGKGSLELDGDVITDDDLPEEVTDDDLNADKLTYTPLPEHDYGNSFTTFDFKVNDGAADSASAATMTIDVASVNDLPVVSDSSVTTDEDTSYAFGVDDFGFSDADQTDEVNELGDSLSHLRITTLPGDGKGMLKFKNTEITQDQLNKTVTRTELGSGDLTYHPPANANGDNFASFQFKAKDGIADSAEAATMTLSVTAEDDPPIAVDDNVMVDANTSSLIPVLKNDSEMDVDGDTLSVTAVGTPDHGTASIDSSESTPTISYSPNFDFIGTDTFTYEISDGQSSDRSTATVNVTVIPKLDGLTDIDYVENNTATLATYTATGTPTWSLSGDDSALFSIDEGILSFNSPPDFENKMDSDTDNKYKITVQATVMVNGVPYTNTRDVIVTVTDVDEDVVWSVPQNTEFSFAENGTGVAATFTITDPENDLGGLSADGDDLGSFTFTSSEISAGVREFKISFRGDTSPDYEEPTDSDMDNVYEASLFTITGDIQGDYKPFILYFTIRVTDVNEVPVAVNDTDAATNEDEAVVISVLGNDTDVDAGTTLSVTRVGTADGVDTATESNPANGTVDITDNGTTVTYTPNADFNGTDTFTYVVSDGELTDIGTVTVTVNAVNDAPVTGDDTDTTVEGTAVDIDVLANDTDADIDTLSVTQVGTADGVNTATETNPANGTAVWDATDERVTYTPDADFVGIDSFTYTVSDGQDPPLTATGTVTVKVTPTVTGSAETGSADAPSYAENGTGAVATYTAKGSPTWTVSGTDSAHFSIDAEGALNFKQPPDFENPINADDDNVYAVTVQATITDGDNSVTGTLPVTVTVTNVDAANDPPVARDDTDTTVEGTAVDIDVLANDTSDVGTTLSVTQVGTADGVNTATETNPANGTAVWDAMDERVTYTPDADFVGIDSFTYTVSDGQDPPLTATGTVTVKVAPTVAGPAGPSYAENGTGAVATYSATGTPTWSLSGVDSAHFSIDTNGALNFKQPPDFENPINADDDNVYAVTVQATITDGDNSVTGTLPVSVRVTGVNESPVAMDDTASTDEDTAVVISVLTNNEEDQSDTDQDANTTLSVTQVGTADGVNNTATETNPANGTVDITDNGTTVTYTPNADFNGTDTFTYVVSDGELTDIGTVTVTVNAVNNDPPVAVNDTDATNEDEAVVISVLGNDTDADAETTLSVTRVGTADGLNTVTETNPTNGTADITDNGTTVTYTPDADFNGTGTFTYVVSDGELTDIGTVIVTVNAVNDAPVTGDDEATTNEVTPIPIEVLNNDTDADIDTLSVTQVGTADGVNTATETNPANGTADITDNGTTVTYTPDADFAGIDSFTYTVSDDQDPPLTATGTVTVKVTPTVTGSAETGSADAPSYAENGTGAVATYTAKGSPTWTVSGTDSAHFSIDAEGALNFKQPPDFENPINADDDNVYAVTVQATITDGDNSVTGTLPVTVTVTNVDAANDPPVARDDTDTTVEGTAVDIDVLANDTSDVGTTLSVTQVGTADGVNTATETNPANGTAVWDAMDERVTYTPDADFVGIDSFTYTVSDGQDPPLTATGTVTVKVAPTVAGPAGPSYAENGTNVVGTYTAAGNPNPTWILSGVDSAHFSIDTNGALNFKQPPDFENPINADKDNVYAVTLAASADGVAGTSRAVNVTVTDVNEAPMALADTTSTDENTAVVIFVLGNDTDQDANTTLSVTAVGPAANGTATITGGETTVTYTPYQYFVGTDSFTYTISDGTNTATATVTVLVVPQVSGPQDISYAENGTGPVGRPYQATKTPSWSLSGDDSNLFMIDTDGNGGGVLNFIESPDFEFPADADGNNAYVVTVDATVDVNGVSLKGSQDVTVTVTNVANSNTDPPVVRDDEATTVKGTVIDINVLANDSADLATTLRVSGVETEPANGTAIRKPGSDTTITYTPNQDFLGIDSFSYTATTDGITTATGMVTVKVTPGEVSYAENGTGSVATFTAKGSSTWDLSGDDSARFTINGEGVLSFNEPPDYENPADGDDDNAYAIGVEATIRAGDNSATHTLDVTVSVTDANDAPVTVGDDVRIDEDTAAVVIEVLDNDTDQDPNTTLSVSAVSTPANGTATITEGSTTTVTYTPNADFNGTDTFIYTVSDDATPALTAVGRITVSVTAANDPPTGGDSEVTTNEDEAYAFRLTDFSYSDIESDPLSKVKLTELPGTDTGTLKFDNTDISGAELPKDVTQADLAAGKLTYTPPANENGDDYASFKFKVNDGASDSQSQYTMTVDVTAANDPPTGGDSEVTTNEDEAYAFQLTDFSYSDIESDPLSKVKLTELPGTDTGTLKFDNTDISGAELPKDVTQADFAAGKLTYTPPANANGDDYTSFKFKVNDGTSDSVQYTMTIDVTALNDQPVGADKAVTTDKNTAYTFAVTDFGFMDVDSDELFVKITSLSGEGRLSLDDKQVNVVDITDSNPVEVTEEQIEGGLLIYTPPADVIGTPLATFTFKVNDGELDSEEQTISIDVTDIVDNADLKQLTILGIEDEALGFSEEKTDYIIKVPSGMDKNLVLTLTTDDNGATMIVMVDGKEVISESSSGDITNRATVVTSKSPGFAIHLAEGRKTTVTITVTAEDRKTTKTYTITLIPPWAYVTGTPLPSLTLYVGEDPKPMDADPAIDGDNLTWTFKSSDPAVASVPEEPTDNPTVMVTPVREGEATITVVAGNDNGPSLPVPFTVTVRTSAVEKEAIRAALSGQARVLLGSVTDMIGQRMGGSGGAGHGPGSSCHSSSAGADGDNGDSGYKRHRRVIHGTNGDSSDRVDRVVASDTWQGDGWNADQAGMDLRGVPRVGHRSADSTDRTFDDLLELFRGRPYSLLPVNLTADCGTGAVGDVSRPWTLWAGADLQWAKGGTDYSDFDGEWEFLYLGADRAFSGRWLGGLSLSRVWGEVDYSFADASAVGGGKLSSNLTALYPYLHGQLNANLEFWLIGGIGFGDMENEREHVDGHRDRGDLDMSLLSVGLRRSLSQAGSAMDLAFTSDAGFVSLSVDGDGSLEDAEASIGRFRLGLEMSRPFANGAEPFAQLHGRYDGGDGPTGAAGEMVLGVRYGGERLNVEVRGNYLTSAADFEQWGANARLDYVPATDDGTGLNLTLTSKWGAAENGGSFLQGHTMRLPASTVVSELDDSIPAQFSGGIGYGFAMERLPGRLTPNLRYDHSGNGASRSRVGLTYAVSRVLNSDIELRLDLARSEHRQENPDHSIELRTTLRF